MIRYLAYGASLVMALVSLLYAMHSGAPGWIAASLGFGALVVIGTLDILQPNSTLRRLYPLLAHFRYMLESFRPEIRQYFIEDDQDEVPFSRQQRALVYQRAKNVSDVVPFGSELPMYGSHYEWINHSLVPAHAESHDFRIPVGEERARPYAASVLNISAMSFGSLSANAIRALNLGAKRGGFYHDTGEGSIASYHREHGGDLVWQIASGYFGCRDAEGRFDEERFAEQAADPQVRMIELKLSQGAKPGHGGMLPGRKVTPEIARTRGIPVGVDCESPAAHSTFSTPVGLLEFVERLRTLSGGKPTGFKLAIGHPWEWFGIAKAMLETGILPDFIVVDGAEGGTGAAPSEFINHVGLPLQEALLLAHNTLVGIGLRERVRIAAAGKITSGFDIARTLALGADWCNAGRSFMFALGCIQSRTCHTDLCPTGVATQDPARWRLLDVPDKADRVFHFQQNTLRGLRDMLGAAGLEHPMQLGPEHILRRVSPTEVRSLAALYRFLEPGELLRGVPEHAVFKTFWPVARADSFAPPARASAMHATKRPS
ncbi:FMN-binding glutamate synthase family protein [Luteimonas deserti]|uniref:Alpha-hydroxy-acid oxidizing protein n=1 Tax=Luteimonas deserti TaxID=2752306 RepID=A0A7Z0TZH4_9GAMM|nr:glutamate synthase-related protein [Luteimonas deserti]NYZ63980.1 alpha-hydroxy-acid oxidizing protein [Luteimonas deserti]